MSPNEKQTLLETRLRNLKRRKAKLLQHASLLDEAIETQKQINQLEHELQ